MRKQFRQSARIPYMQHMLGLSEFTTKPVFDPSLFVTIRKRIGVDDFNDMRESLLKLQVELLEKEEKEGREKKEKDENGSNDNNHEESEPMQGISFDLSWP